MEEHTVALEKNIEWFSTTISYCNSTMNCSMAHVFLFTLALVKVLKMLDSWPGFIISFLKRSADWQSKARVKINFRIRERFQNLISKSVVNVFPLTLE